ncbi:hypothetical protein GIB67_022131 [Kingdonia uniflora]|uniref:Uncharacterized protein n=1 Tax=Kingdonia uniflora TaxID=39325 RepID=A0A7J7N8V5_9MAGN|nr:hypothetical protein GIB67_022131 [Kingdonia uniflora]
MCFTEILKGVIRSSWRELINTSHASHNCCALMTPLRLMFLSTSITIPLVTDGCLLVVSPPKPCFKHQYSFRGTAPLVLELSAW